MRPESAPSRRALHDSGRPRRPAPGDPGARGHPLAPHAHLPGDRQSSASALPGRAGPKPGRHPPRQRSAGGRLAPGFRSTEPRPSRARDGRAPGSASAPRIVATQDAHRPTSLASATHSISTSSSSRPSLDRRARRIPPARSVDGMKRLASRLTGWHTPGLHDRPPGLRRVPDSRTASLPNRARLIVVRPSLALGGEAVESPSDPYATRRAAGDAAGGPRRRDPWGGPPLPCS